ncbi:MAG: methyltransferase domain-containing protein [Desulfovibrionaceae bacterium]|nr:methyltransferase domain-containing protein [Desulfovibrionaceae bacterium]MBF0515150.1 methyltransferase domain-containing protein [Desulfovibrionaceae bacterium]
MNATDISYIHCPSCGSPLDLVVFEEGSHPGTVAHGILACHACKTMFPIDKSIPLLIDVGYIPDFDQDGFALRWRDSFDFAGYRRFECGTNDAKMRQVLFFNNDADYDDDVAESSFWRAVDASILGYWTNDIISKQGAVLDLGCGTGRIGIPLAQQGLHVLSTDISIGMLRKAREKAQAAGLSHMTFFLADAECLPLAPARFSAVISYGMLHHVDQPVAILKGVKRLLVDGGLFFALENHASPVRFIFDFLMRRNPLWEEEAGSHPLFKIKELIDLAETAGLSPKARTSVFLPPHFFNRLGYSSSKRLIDATDRSFGWLPVLRNFGGQVVLKAVKTVGIPSEMIKP